MPAMFRFGDGAGRLNILDALSHPLSFLCLLDLVVEFPLNPLKVKLLVSRNLKADSPIKSQ